MDPLLKTSMAAVKAVVIVTWSMMIVKILKTRMMTMPLMMTMRANLDESTDDDSGDSSDHEHDSRSIIVNGVMKLHKTEMVTS